MNISQYAVEFNVPIQILLKKLKEAGINKSRSTDQISVEDRQNLLNYLSKEISGNELHKYKKIYVRKAQTEPSQPVLNSIADYEWPGKFLPFQHQKATTEFLIQHDRAFCLNDMGTGKTLSVLWALDYLRRIRVIGKVLVICPLSTLYRTWLDEINQHFPHLKAVVLHGSASERLMMLNRDVDVFLINHDGIKVAGFVDAMAKREDIDLIVIDEIAQVARNASIARFKSLNYIVNRQVQRRAWGLTGTPIPNDPADAWAQCRLLFTTKITPYSSKFKQQVLYREEELKVPLLRNSGFNRITHQLFPKTPDEVIQSLYTFMQPSIRYARDECIDLPPLSYETREVGMSTEQAEVYHSMLLRLKAEFERGEITAGNELSKANKLLQIACGVPYSDDGGSIALPIEHRLSVVEDIIESAGSKVIVFVPFLAALKVVSERLAKRYSLATMSGKVPIAARDKIFNDFQNSTEPKVLVAQPASMSHGLTLTAASTIIWFSPIWSNDISTQANCRITRPGQKLNQLIVNIEGSSIERRVYNRLREKGRVQGLLLDMLAEMV